ncbi:MAG: TonB-dependent receptor plug domain-containing protein [Leptospiraceae bacterium]|nr:TonB-dependent receptor plug domain-containing protein [Leptospiraceae bacterium]
MRIFIYIIILIILSPLWADENPEVKETEKVRVVGKKDKDEYESLEGTEKNPSGFSSVIPLEDTKDKYNSIDEVLEKESGLRVRRYGGLGAYSTLSIRGANPNQVKFYIDGVPINNNVGGEINLAELPFENLESIEVHKSGSSYGLSSSSVGGAVNLKTRKGKKKKKESRILLGGGSFHTIKGTVSHYDNTGEDLGYGFLASSEKSDGDFRFRNDNGTPVINTYDDYDDIRKNSWYERSAVSGTVNLKKGNTEYKLFNDFLYRMYGLPGQSNRTEKVKRKYLRNTSALGSTSKGIGFDNLNLSTRLYYTGMRDQLFDPKEEITYSEPNSRADIQQYGIHLLPEIYLLSYHQILRFMFGLERETFKNDKRNTDDKIVEKLPRKFRSHDLVQLEDEFRFFKKRLRIIPSYKWEIYHDRYNENILKKDYYNLAEKDSSIQRLTSKKLGGLIVPYKEKHLEFAWKANVSEEYRRHAGFIIPILLIIYIRIKKKTRKQKFI